MRKASIRKMFAGLVLLIITLLCLSPQASAQSPQAANVKVVYAGRLLDGTSNTARTNVSIIIDKDRIREVRGKNPLLTPQIINDSVNQTLSRTLLTTGYALLVVIALLLLGGDVVHGFAFALFVGMIAGTYSTVFIASPLLVYCHAWTRSRAGRSPGGAIDARQP